MLARLTRYWVYGGTLSGLLLLALLPALMHGWTVTLTEVFLQLPIDMLHQGEEHDNDVLAWMWIDFSAADVKCCRRWRYSSSTCRAYGA